MAAVWPDLPYILAAAVASLSLMLVAGQWTADAVSETLL